MDPPRHHPADIDDAAAARGELRPRRAVAEGAAAGDVRGPLQWALEGPGWSVRAPGGGLRAAVRRGGRSPSAACGATLHAPALQRAAAGAAAAGDAAVLPARPVPHAPARAGARRHRAGRQRRIGRRRWRWRCSACSSTGSVPSQIDWVRAWLFALIARRRSGASRCRSPSAGRARSRLVGKPVLIMGAGVVGAQVARRLESHPEYGLVPVGFLDEDPRSVAEVGGRDVPVLGTVEDLDETVAQHGREEPDRGLLLRRRRARQPPDPALPGARRRGVGGAADVRHDQQSRRLRHRRRAAADVVHDRRPQGRAVRAQARAATASSRCCC